MCRSVTVVKVLAIVGGCKGFSHLGGLHAGGPMGMGVFAITLVAMAMESLRMVIVRVVQVRTFNPGFTACAATASTHNLYSTSNSLTRISVPSVACTLYPLHSGQGS